MTNNRLLLLCVAGGLAVAGCNNNPPANPGTDAGSDGGGGGGDTGVDGGGADQDTNPPMTDAGLSATCDSYCAFEVATCTGENAQYADVADCMAQCTALAWAAGTVTDTTGNTIGCRVYHSTVAAMSATNATTHCVHTGTTGGGVCGPVAFRTDAATTYTRVDRMGMPAVSTALISDSDLKDAYNDADAAEDTNPGSFALHAGGFLPTLGGVHAALDDDLTMAGLAPCSMSTNEDVAGLGSIPRCAAQTFDGAHPVVGLVIPDTLILDPTHASGFPNGRKLDDHVIDIVLAALLLDLGNAAAVPARPAGTCGGAPCSAATFVASGGLFQTGNDATTLTEFPYLAAPHAP